MFKIKKQQMAKLTVFSNLPSHSHDKIRRISMSEAVFCMRADELNCIQIQIYHSPEMLLPRKKPRWSPRPSN